MNCQTLKGEVCKDKVEWLSRSLVGESIKPIDFDILKEKLYNEWFYLTSVRAMGSYKCLLTFETKEDLEAALSARSELIFSHFDDIRRWLEVLSNKTSMH